MIIALYKSTFTIPYHTIHVDYRNYIGRWSLGATSSEDCLVSTKFGRLRSQQNGLRYSNSKKHRRFFIQYAVSE